MIMTEKFVKILSQTLSWDLHQKLMESFHPFSELVIILELFLE